MVKSLVSVPILFAIKLSVLSVLSFLSTATLLSPPANAEQIKVVTEYLPPFQVKNPDGSLGGYATEVIYALFELTGDVPDIELLPWSRGYRMAQTDKDVMIYSISRTKLREPLFHWIGKLKDERFFVWGLKSKFSQPFNTIDDFRHLVFASSKNYNTEQFLLQNQFKTVQRLNHNDQTIGMLFKKRADLVVGNGLVFKHQAQSSHYDFTQMVKLYEAKSLNTSLSIAFGLKTQDTLVKRYTQAFARLERSGKLAQIKQKWAVKDE